MKIAIIGAGALGIMFAVNLAQDKNNEVVVMDVVDRAINTMNKEGCICYDGDKTLSSKVKAFKSGSLNKPFDLVLILTKTNFTKVSIESNFGLFNKDTYLMTMQNGLGNREKISKYVDKDHLLIAVTKNNAIKMGDNISKRTIHDLTTIGYNKNNKKFVEKVANVFTEASFECHITDNVDRLVWEKAFVNLCLNAYCATYNLSIKELVLSDKWQYAAKALTEAVNVANKLGQKFNADEVISKNYKTYSVFDGRPSMWQDVTAKRPTEIMSLNGRVAELGKELGIDVSENDRITKCIQKIQDSYLKK